MKPKLKSKQNTKIIKSELAISIACLLAYTPSNQAATLLAPSQSQRAHTQSKSRVTASLCDIVGSAVVKQSGNQVGSRQHLRLSLLPVGHKYHVAAQRTTVCACI